MAGNEEYDEEMEAERELADSAMWKVIQKNTFTRWTNEHLKHTKLQIVDMEKDFSDGLKLIALIEALSGKKFAKYNKRPSFRTQKFENVTMSLKFLEDKEGIKLVNIDSSDIVDQKLKLIMGLIWTLILHYSITMPTWEDEGGFGKDQTPKQRLLAWIQNKIPEKNITNFTSDWNDGTAIAALVDAVAPGLFPDWANLLPTNKVQNAKDAMDLAEKCLDVPQVIKPDEMCNPKVDELSMMTYLSRFPSAKIKPGAPVQQKPNAQRIKAYGPGIEPLGNVVGAPARFIVETANAGKGDLEVIVLDPKGKQEKVELLPNNDRTQSYNCVYTPSMDGAYTVSIKFAGQPCTKQPYLVNVAPKAKAGDPSKVVAQGPGIEKSGVMVNRKTYFDVITKGAGIGVVDVGVFDPQGKPLKATVTKKSDDMWYVEYTAEVPGLHSVNVNFAGLPIPKSPYPVGVGTEGGPPVDASRLPGKPIACSPKDAAANSLATPLKAVPGSTAPVAEQPQQQLKPVPGKAPAPGEVPEAQAPGQAQSATAKPGAPPAQIPIDAKKCWASGRGIQPKGVRLGDLADFKIHTENAGNAEPRAMVMGPGGTPVQTNLKKLDDVTYECVYKPTKPGLHIVNVTFAGQQIPKSPFKVDVGPLKTSKVVAFGPGLESGVVNQPAKFTVQPNGEGPIGFKIEGPSQAKIDVTKNPQQTEMYVSYLPTTPGEYAVRILSNNDDIPKSPYIADIRPVGEAPAAFKPSPGQAAAPTVDTSKVTAFGPGLEKEGNVVNKWAEFTVDATKAGQAPLVVTVADADNMSVGVTVVDNKNLTFSCKYLPAKAIKHTVTIVFGGQQVPKSPFLVNVKDGGVGAGRVKVYGPAIEKPVQAKILSYFIIDCKEAGPGEPQITLTNEKGQPLNFQKKDLRDRTYRVEFTALVSGVYTSHVTFSNQPVPKSPFNINVLGGPDASKVKVYGPALEAPVNVNELTYFIVDCKEAGPGEPRVVLIGEKGGSVATKIVDQNDRTYKVEFTAPVAGLYNANVQFASSPVPKSPFRITAQAAVDIRQVFVKDLPEFVPVNKEVTFEVVTAGAGPGKVKVVIISPTGKSVPVRLDEKPGVTTMVKFIPDEPGPYKLEVFFSEKPVAKSPFQVTAEAANPFKVKVYGPAIEKTVFVNEVTYFIVDYKEGGPGEPQVKLVDEKGTPIPFNVLDQKDKTHRIEFTPITPGSSTATVTFAGQAVPKSPFKITVQIKSDTSKVKVYGPALEKSVPIRYSTYFIIDCKEAGLGIPDFNLATEDGHPVESKFIDNKDGTFRVEFTPQSFSPIIAYVNFLGQAAPKSPYKIIIYIDLSKIKVFGPAVEGPVTPKVPTHFIIDCKEVGPGVPKVSLTDDNDATVPFTLNDNKDGTFKVDFIPENTVTLTANVLFADQPVPKSPFKITVLGNLTNRSKVKISGPAFEGPVAPKEPTYFNIECKEAGPGEPIVSLIDDNKAPVPFTIKDNKDGTYTAELTPTSTVPITTEVTFAGQPVPQSPFKIITSLASKVKVYGPAVEKPVAPKVQTYFTVDCKEAGLGQPTVLVVDEKGAPKQFTQNDNKDGTFKVELVPETASPLLAQVSFANQPVSKSPFLINVVGGPANPSAVKVYGPAVEEPVFEKVPTYFVVDCKEAGPSEPTVDLKSEDGTQIKPTIVDNKDQTYKVDFVPVGVKPIFAQVLFVNQPVPKSPFKIEVRPGTFDASKVKLSGPAVEGPVKANVPTYFNIDAKDAGPAKPEVTLATEDNKPVKAKVTDNKDGTYKVDFVPREVKPIVSQVKLSNQHALKSPFKVPVEPGPAVDPAKVKVYGPATEGPVTSSQPTYFVVDAKDAGPGEPEITLATEDGTPVKPNLTDNKDRTYKADFVPVKVQPITAQVIFADEQVPKSPFKIPVEPGASDASKVKLSGPAVEGPVKAGEPTHFVVDAKEAGPGQPEVKLVADNGVAVPTKVKDNNDGTHVVEFVPESVVPITAVVKFVGQTVPKCPFKISVQPASGRKPDASKIKLFGPAVEKPVKCCEPTYFVVDVKEAGPGHPEIALTYENGTPLHPVVSDNKDGTYRVDFVPTLVQPISARVLFAGEHVPKSPLKILVECTSHCDTSKVHVYGPATEGPVKASKPTYFVIDAKEAGPGHPEVVLTTDDGSVVKPKISDNHDGNYKVDFVPVAVKPITAQVKYAGSQVPKSPFKIPVEPGVTDASKVRLSGPAVEGPVKAQEPTYFVVDAKEAGSGQPAVALTTDNGFPVPAKTNDNNDGTFVVTFTPEAVVPITAEVKFDNQKVPKSPFKIPVEQGTGRQPEPSKVKLHGPAVEGPVKSNEPTYFVIDAKEAGPGYPEVSLFPENAAPLKPVVTDNKDGTFKTDFVPLTPKPIVGQVKFAEKQVPKSPFKIQVEPTKSTDVSQVKIFGPATEGPVKSNQPTYFVVDAKEAGPGYPEVALTVDDGSLLKPKITDNKDGTYRADFLPVAVKPITAQVKYAGSQVPKSPFKIPVEPGVTDVSKVRLSGPAVEGPVKAQEPTYFVVDAKEAGPEKPEVKLIAANGAPVPVKVKDNHDGTHIADFVPEAVVPITAEVKFAGQQVPKSPLQIPVEPSSGKKPDAAKAKLYGPAVEGPVKSNRPTYFVVDAKESGPGLPEVTLLPESAAPLKPSVTDNKDGTYKVDFVPVYVQPITAHVKFAEQEVPKSPFKVSVEPATESDASKVKLHGPAVEGPVKSNQPTYFVVDAKEAGPGYPEVVISTDDGSLVTPSITDNKDGTYTVEFVPAAVRPLTVQVKYAGKPVPKSPFKVTVVAGGVNPSKVKLSGPATEGPVKSQEPTYFVIDAKEAGPDQPEVKLTPLNSPPLPVHIIDNHDGTYVADFVPEAVVPITAEVKYAGQQVPKSPLQIPVELGSSKKPDSSKVKLYGPAVEGPVKSNKPTYFVVDTKEAGPGGHPAVELVAEGGTPLKPTVADNKDGTFKVDFVPLVPQPIIGQVKYAGQQVPKSPFKVPVELTPGGDASKVKLSGPALEGPIKSNQPTYFVVDAKEAGPGYPEVALTTDSGTPIKPNISEVANGIYKVDFVPTAVQTVAGEVKFAGQQVLKSPFRIPVEPGTGPDVTKVKVYGPAVEQPVKSQEPTHFFVDTRESGPVAEPNVNILKSDGSSLPIQKTDNKDGTYRVDFTPQDVGVVLSNVAVAGRPVPGSPFKTTVQPKSQSPAKVSDIPKTLTVGKPEPINIQLDGPKKGPATVELVVPFGNVVSSPVYDKPDGYLGQVTATEPGPHKIVIKVANEPVEGSPFHVDAVPASLTFTPSDVVDASKVKVYGPGLAGGTTNKPCDFTIDTSAAGPGNLGLTIDGPTEAKIECFDKGNGVFDVRYLPNEPGEYTINVTFDEKPVLHSPFKAQINPEILVDVSRVRTYGPGVQPQGVYLDSVTEFTVNTATVQPKGVGNIKVILTNSSGTLTEAIVNKNNDDTYTCLYTPFEEGPTKIDVTYDGLKVPGSPFVTNVTPGCDPSKVKVYGSGIERGEPNKPQKFIINTRGAGVGGVGLSVVGPTEPQVDCTDNQDGTLSVEYLPETPGDYEIGVTFADQPVPGSPFIVPIGEAVKPFFPDRVKCFGPGLNPQGVKQGQKALFSVVTNQAGEAPLEVVVNDLNTGSKLPVRINKNPSGTYDVEYEPHNEGALRIDVLYGGKPVPGSPFNTSSKPFVDLSKVAVTGDGVKPQVPASLPVTFSVDTRAAAPSPLPVDIDIKTPQGKVVKPAVTPVTPEVTQVSYTPEDAGPYQIHVRVGSQEIPNSPVRVTAVPTGNPEKVILPDSIPPSVAPNQTFTFKVQKPAATGPGNVSCKVTKAGQPGFPATEISATVQDNHDGTVLVSYPVPDDGVLVVETKFGGVLIPRGRFTQKVGKPGEPTLTPLIPTSIATGEVCPQTPQSPITPISPSAPLRPVEVSSIPVGPDLSQVSAVVIKPSGERLPVQVVETERGTIRVNYTPTETGLHHLKVLYAGQPVPGDPFTFFVHAPVSGQVTAFGPGLVSGSVNQPCVFTVVTKNAGKGGLSLAIEGPSKAEIKCKDNRDGSATITYVPTSPGEYKIVVKHAGQPIPGAPFVAKIIGEDRSIFTRSVTTTEQSTITRQSHVTVGSTRHLSIQVTESDLSNLSALIRSPSGVEEPCGLKRQPSGQLGISFTPKESGEHLVIVFRNGQPIPGSPFRVFIQAAEVGEASRVKIYGENLVQGQANEFNSFIINTKEAGVAGLSISVQGPGKVDIKCTENEDGTTKVIYKPTEPGVYHVTIKYGDKPVPGSPFTINVGGVPSGRVKERIVRQQQAATMTSVGTTCELNITMPGININEIEGCVTSPSGQIERCQIIDLGSNKFRISFSPKESGIHYVSLKHKGLHIPGSPFQFTVGPIVGGGPEKVRAIGPGLVRGEANKPCHFTVITREAGAGSLSLGVEGPSKAIIDFQDRKDGTSDVNYICSEPGEYLVSVKFNGQHIPDSPFKVYISSTGGDINKLHVQNLQQHGLPVNIQTQFLVEFNGAQGKLDARVVAPSGQETEATVQEIRPGHFSIVFLPKESGVHYVHLLLNGNHIPGSPYPVQVGVINADPSRVRAYGEGLHHGQSGKPCKFIVNTTESGPGALSVGISGPSKVELQTREVEEGYEFTYTPLAPGSYLITIKYAGNTHIPGSPFKAQIEGVGTPAAFTEQSRVIVETVTKTTTSSITSHQGELICDVSKVAASGPGLSQTTVNQDSLFTVDGSQAGYNVLHVGVAGPHIPVDKVFINHLGDLRYSVRYQVSQPGRYLIYVKWGEQHIPGSPFVVIAK